MVLLSKYGTNFPAQRLNREMERLSEDFFKTPTMSARLTKRSPLVAFKEEAKPKKVTIK